MPPADLLEAGATWMGRGLVKSPKFAAKKQTSYLFKRLYLQNHNGSYVKPASDASWFFTKYTWLGQNL